MSVNTNFSEETIKIMQKKISHTLKHTKKHSMNLPSDVPLLFFFLSLHGVLTLEGRSDLGR